VARRSSVVTRRDRPRARPTRASSRPRSRRALDDPARLVNASLDGNTPRAIDLHERAELDAEASKALVRAAVDLDLARATLTSLRATDRYRQARAIAAGPLSATSEPVSSLLVPPVLPCRPEQQDDPDDGAEQTEYGGDDERLAHVPEYSTRRTRKPAPLFVKRVPRAAVGLARSDAAPAVGRRGSCARRARAAPPREGRRAVRCVLRW
jgi:hypothetical protein